MNNKQRLIVVRNSLYWAFGIALVYGLLVTFLPTMIQALELPDPRALRSEIVGDVCDRVGSSVCDRHDESGHSGGGDTGGGTGGSGDDDDDDDQDTGGGNGGGSGGSNPDVATLTVLTQSGVVATDELDVPNRVADDVLVTPTSGNNTVEVEAESALALLLTLDDESDAFEITDLQYYPSFVSFFLNCITIGDEELCGNWQYVVNGEYPSVGLDKYELEEGDNMFVFFGSPREVTAPARVLVGEPFTVVAKQYDPESGTYKPVTGYTVGVVQDDPDDPLVPIEIVTSEVNENGEATFTLTELGNYKLGIQEDYYFPTTPLAVVETLDTPTTGGGGGGSIMNTDDSVSFDVPDALAFIQSMQEDTGSFGAPMFTDWAAIALVAGNANTSEVRAYLVDADDDFTSLTDHERRAMALMALGVSPYHGTDTNHIAAILSYFGGTQFGDPAEVNDDIFALLVLTAAGYDASDTSIVSSISFLVAEQRGNGSWDSDVDMTSAAIQALAPYDKMDDVELALFKAAAFLRIQQNSDAGFGSSFDGGESNSFTTSWALMAIEALGEQQNDWDKGGVTPLEYLALEQENDGGVEERATAPTTRLWATSYAIPAALGLTWYEIMDSYDGSDVGSTVTTGGGSITRTDETGEGASATGTTTDDTGASSSAATSTDADTAGLGDGAGAANGVVFDPTQLAQATPPAPYTVPPLAAVAPTSTTDETSTTTATSSDDADQLAAVAEVGGDGTFTALRALAVLFAAALIGFVVFNWRKA